MFLADYMTSVGTAQNSQAALRLEGEKTLGSNSPIIIKTEQDPHLYFHLKEKLKCISNVITEKTSRNVKQVQ